MKNTLILSLLSFFLMTGCFLQDGIRGNGNVTKEQRTVSSFDKIEIASGPFTVHLLQGDTESVEVEIDENLQQYVEVQNEGGKLVVRVKDGFRIEKTTKNNIYISLKTIDIFSVSGVCTIKTTGTLKCSSLTLTISGVTDCELDLSCDKLVANISGVTNIELRGNATELSIKQSSVGSLNAKKLIAEKADIINSGVGSVSVFANQELSLHNSGVGSITYSGDAVIKSIHSSGVGKISKE
jgi:hypothetical protein